VPVFDVDTTNTNLLNAIRPYIGWNRRQCLQEIYTSNSTQCKRKFRSSSRQHAVQHLLHLSHCLTTYQADPSTGSICRYRATCVATMVRGIADRRHVVTGNFVWGVPYFRRSRASRVTSSGGWKCQASKLSRPVCQRRWLQQSVDPTGADCLGPSPCCVPRQSGG